MALQQLIH